MSLEVVAAVHLAGAFAILSFLIVHLYMITTGHTVFAHTRAMISGWELVDEKTEIEDWEQKQRKEPQPAV
jgi:cytochrome b subunit of formate dehydrogenase